MKKKILNIALIIGIIVTVLLLGTVFSDYNLKKTVSACILAKKQISKSFDIKKAKKFCEDDIRKQTNNSK